MLSFLVIKHLHNKALLLGNCGCKQTVFPVVVLACLAVLFPSGPGQSMQQTRVTL